MEGAAAWGSCWSQRAERYELCEHWRAKGRHSQSPSGLEGVGWGVHPVQVEHHELLACGDTEVDKPNHCELCGASASCPCCSCLRPHVSTLWNANGTLIRVCAGPHPFLPSLQCQDQKKAQTNSPHPLSQPPLPAPVTVSTFPF